MGDEMEISFVRTDIVDCDGLGDVAVVALRLGWRRGFDVVEWFGGVGWRVIEV